MKKNKTIKSGLKNGLPTGAVNNGILNALNTIARIDSIVILNIILRISLKVRSKFSFWGSKKLISVYPGKNNKKMAQITIKMLKLLRIFGINAQTSDNRMKINVNTR